MPTGYTADVQSGKVTSLRQYALECARAFGALVMMRDEPHDAEIPARFEPSTSYYDEQLKSDSEEIVAVHAMSPDAATIAALADWTNAKRAYADRQEERNVSLSRYLAMREQVELWTVPPELAGLREFMVRQINESIRFDCGGEERRNAYHDADVPTLKSGDEWKRQKLEALSRSIAYHTDKRASEVRRTEERNKWIAALRASLPNE